MSILAREELEASPLADLHAIASELGIEGFRRLRKADLIAAIVGDRPREEVDPGAASEAVEPDRTAEVEAPAADDDTATAARPRRRRRGRRTRPEAEDEGDEGEESPSDREAADAAAPSRTGVLDILPNGSGFLRAAGFTQSRDDAYVSPAQVRRCELRPGDELAGPVREPRRSERHPSLVRVDTVNGAPAEPPVERPRFDELTPVFASERLPAPEGLGDPPFGKGSRVAIGGAPGAGATTLLRQIVATLAESRPEIELVVLLAGVRPEEVTEWRRGVSVPVAGGGFDRPLDDQVRAAEMAVDRAHRVVELGRDAALAVDSLDALPGAAARRLFGSARKTEEAGSLTVVATTGLAGELQRLATTRIVLDVGATGRGEGPSVVGPASGTIRAQLLA